VLSVRALIEHGDGDPRWAESGGTFPGIRLASARKISALSEIRESFLNVGR
jgi:hypothetical protein